MCGIAGIWNRDGREINRDVIDRMLSKVSYRGPNDSGIFNDQNIAFGHKRLSIIDLTSAGKQPMIADDGNYWLTFNGEIYNFQELKQKFLSGIKFKSHSDTEVLLHLLSLKGETIIPELRGMFAFAFYDKKKEKLLLARDPFGKKPLYYVQKNGFFAFASEAKSLFPLLFSTPEINKEALTQYFLYEYFPTPLTPYKDIFQLPMGSYLVVEREKISEKKYWTPVFNPKTELDESEKLKNLDRLFEESVRRRLIADVPVGLFLSGGLDSTTIGWYMKKLNPSSEFHSFSVSFEQNSFDESSYAGLAAKHLNLIPHTLNFSLDDFEKSIAELSSLVDSPLADASLVPTYAVSKLAKKYVTVTLDGDGGDELLGGYGTFEAAKLAERLNFLPKSAIQLANELASFLPTNHDYFSFDFKLKSFLKGLDYKLPERNQIWLGSFSNKEIASLLKNPDLKNIFQPVKACDNPSLNSLDRISLLTIKTYLTNDILVKLDRASMYNSLESRTPFLDIDLADFSFKLDPKEKINKLFLKKLMVGRIPDTIIKRKKQGFALPLGHWLKGPLKEWAVKILNRKKLEEDGVLNPETVEKLLRQHFSGQADNRKKIWTLLSYQIWFDNYFL